nr:bidirectional sugar transporter SWEET5-like [Coffea arabica]
MADKELTRTVLGVIGNIISFCMFLSPAPTFAKIWKAKSVQHFKPDPYLATILNCALWVFYGLPIVKEDSILVSTINGVGFAIEVIFIAIFVIYSDWPKRRKIFMFLVIEAIFFAIVVIITVAALHGNQRSLFVGVLSLIFNIMMYFSPLTIMRRVIQTKSVKYMPFYLSLANFANGAIWFSYAFLKFDPWLVIPNGCGAVAGLTQLILYATYYRSTNWDEEENPKEVQLSSEA